MTKHPLVALIAIGVLTLTACPKNEAEGEDGDTVVGDGDGDEAEDDTTTTAETGESGTTDTTGESDTGNFLNTDMMQANTCDPWAQDCPEGEKCAAYSSGGDTWDANKCVPIMGDGVEGDVCTYDGALAGTDTCDVGFMCYYTNAEGQGTCIPLCTGTPESGMCPPGFNCSISNEGSLLLCVYACNPVLQDCAAEGTGCFWDGVTFNCDPAGDLMTGDPCGYINDCAPGNLCADASALPSCAGSACCAAYCDLEDPVCPLPDTECVSFFEEGTAPPGYETVGVCILPGA